MRPRFAINLRPENRGRGECRAPDAPAASCAHGVVSMHTSIHSEPSEITRHSRTQWFYGLYRALPGDRLSCHRHLRKPGSYAPGRADLPSANLTPASRRQDHTSSPSASNIVRQHAGRRSRETRPAIPCPPDAAASIATRPNVHDDGQRPSDRDGMAVDIQVIWVFGKPEYFFKRGWTRRLKNSLTGKSVELSAGGKTLSRLRLSLRYSLDRAD